MSNLREEFEKFPEIAQALQLIDGFDGYKYYSLNNHRTADWLNGAYYAFQEQQKKIEAVLDLVKDAQNGDYGFTFEGGDIDLFAKEIKELLK